MFCTGYFEIGSIIFIDLQKKLFFKLDKFFLSSRKPLILNTLVFKFGIISNVLKIRGKGY